MQTTDRRRILQLSATALVAAAAAPMLTACGKEVDAKEVLAVEDMMREHGLLRRALLVYAEAASRLRAGQGEVPADQLAKTADIFRKFGEEYHERLLEEAHVFPAVEKSGSAVAGIPAVLKAQHDRGREITDYITAVTRTGKISPADTAPLALTMETFVRMYQHHAAIEDTLIFPAWKKTMSSKEYDHMSDQFEDLETKMFGKDGFESYIAQIGVVEQAFGIADLSQLTPPSPPKPAGA
jgi:hemerythrin-like domain-containing protein